MAEVICTECSEDLNNCSCEDCGCKACSVDNCRCQHDHADRLIQDASTPSAPNLGALMRAGKKQGLIKPMPAYGG